MPADVPYGIGSDVWPGLGKAQEEMGELLEVLGKIIGAGGTLKHKWECSTCEGERVALLPSQDRWEIPAGLCHTCGGTGYMGSGDLSDALHDEAADVLAAVAWFCEINPEIDCERVSQRALEKQATFRRWRESGVF